jgi:hypothetical protein
LCVRHNAEQRQLACSPASPQRWQWAFVFLGNQQKLSGGYAKGFGESI